MAVRTDYNSRIRSALKCGTSEIEGVKAEGKPRDTFHRRLEKEIYGPDERVPWAKPEAANLVHIFFFPIACERYPEAYPEAGHPKFPMYHT